MSDEGEKTCPLCAEEMDLTDQQLKPCKCGYEICVWCWHHIMDMAEKDDTEGRCPACRSPYNKEKIVGMATKCERLVAEINFERQKKSQKGKAKSSEIKKPLSSVRVIQRNLVYIVGLPLNLGDEELLQRKEFFGQYGKVLKVSMSRTAAGVIQQFPNNTCSVYITYSKEEEAVRCIQSVHGFVLEGKALKACFGTTKYCHAWLRNVPCTNPDCLYLHEVGSQEDSFTKDEIISAYTRSRVQQITGATINQQRRSGNVLPPPLDDYCPNYAVATAKPVVKNVSNTTASVSKEPAINGSSARSVALPAAASWGMRASNQQPVPTSASSNGPSRQKSDTIGVSLAFSSAAANTTPAFAPTSTVDVDVVRRPMPNGDTQITHPKPLRQHIAMDFQVSTEERPATENEDPATVKLSSQFSCPSLSQSNDRIHSLQPNTINSLENTVESCFSGAEKDEHDAADNKIRSLCTDMSAISIDRNIVNEHSGTVRPSGSLPDHGLSKASGYQVSQQYYDDQSRESLMTPATIKSLTSSDEVVSREQFDWKTNSQTQAVVDATLQEDEDVLSFDNQRLNDPEVVCRSSYLPNLGNSHLVSNHSRSHSLQHKEPFAAVSLNADPQFVDNKVSEHLHLNPSSVPLISNGYLEKMGRNSAGFDRTAEHFMLSNEDKAKPVGRSRGDVDINGALDAGENSIISNILSMDLDAWDDSFALPQNFSKLLGEADKEPSSLRTSGSWKAQNQNQSRFPFARQEESKHQAFDFERSIGAIGQSPNNRTFSQGFTETRDPFLDKVGIRNGFYPSSIEESDNFINSPSVFASSRLPVSRSQMSAPPGFAAPTNRAPPPGFSSYERVDQSFDTMSGNHMLDSSSLLRNSYQNQSSGNFTNSADIEFIDPAILAVGKGRIQGGLNNTLDMRSNFPQQLNGFDNEAALQLMMQRSISQQQNLRYNSIGDGYSSLNDSYGIPSRLMDQTQASNQSPFAHLSVQQPRNPLMSNGHWDGWNEVQGGNNLGMAELLRNDRLGFNKYYNGYEDSKFRMPSSGDLYNRTFGM